MNTVTMPHSGYPAPAELPKVKLKHLLAHVFMGVMGLIFASYLLGSLLGMLYVVFSDRPVMLQAENVLLVSMGVVFGAALVPAWRWVRVETLRVSFSPSLPKVEWPRAPMAGDYTDRVKACYFDLYVAARALQLERQTLLDVAYRPPLFVLDLNLSQLRGVLEVMMERLEQSDYPARVAAHNAAVEVLNGDLLGSAAHRA